MSGAKLQSESVSRHSPSERKLRQDGFGISWLALQWLGCKLFAHRSEVPWKALHSRLTQLLKPLIHAQSQAGAAEPVSKTSARATARQTPTRETKSLQCYNLNCPVLWSQARWAPRFGHTSDSCKKM